MPPKTNTSRAHTRVTTAASAEQLAKALDAGKKHIQVTSLDVIGATTEKVLAMAGDLHGAGVVLELPPGSVAWADLVVTSRTLWRLLMEGDPDLKAALENPAPAARRPARGRAVRGHGGHRRG